VKSPIILYLLALTAAAQAQTFTILASFSDSNGSSPNTLVQGADGNFYGTTLFGDIFKMTPAGALTTLYTFPNFRPENSLMQASDGNFYGTNADSIGDVYGSIFEIDACRGSIDSAYLHGTRRRESCRLDSSHRRELLRHDA
jgi:hypothetical protein